MTILVFTCYMLACYTFDKMFLTVVTVTGVFVLCWLCFAVTNLLLMGLLFIAAATVNL